MSWSGSSMLQSLRGYVVEDAQHDGSRRVMTRDDGKVYDDDVMIPEREFRIEKPGDFSVMRFTMFRGQPIPFNKE